MFQYVSGSSTKLTTYTTSSGSVANPNPIVLDSGGNLTGSREVWLIQSSTYRFILAPSTDTDPPVSPYWTMDSISGVNDVPTQLSIEWVTGSSAVFQNASTFVISGDVTQTYTRGRRVRFFDSSGTGYGMISSSVFSTSTTITILNDSGAILDSGLTSVDYSVFGAAHVSFPFVTLNALNGPNWQFATIYSSSVQFNQNIGFYGTAPIGQPNISTVVTTTPAVSASPWGFSTSSQANALILQVSSIAQALKTLGLSA